MYFWNSDKNTCIAIFSILFEIKTPSNQNNFKLHLC